MDDVFAPSSGASPPSRRVPVCVLLALAALACGEENRAPATFAVRDSSGIRIAESDGPGWLAASAWRVSRSPDVRIGAAEGDSTQLLFRVVGAARLSDGRIAIGNGGTHEIRVYGPDGVWLASVGRRGGGPGEFGRLDWVGRAGGDSIAAFDHEERRVSIFSPAGVFARSFRLQEPPPGRFFYPTVLGRLDDGRFVVAGNPTWFTGPTYEGVPEDSVVYLLYDSDGDLLGRMLSVPATERWVRSDERSGTSLEVPFGRRTHAAVHGRRVFIGTSDAYQVAVHGPDGTLETLVRRRWTPTAVTPLDAARYREEAIAAAADQPDWQRRLAGHLDRIPFAETLPAFSSFLVGDLGHLWVEEYRRPGAMGGPRWAVFDPEGRLLGTVTLPEGLRPLQVGEDFLLGTRTDDLGVEYVEVYGLRRTTSEEAP